MAADITYIVRTERPLTSCHKREVLDRFGIAEDKLALLLSSGLIVPETQVNEEMFSQASVDQIHNILMLEQLFNIDPKSIRPLYNSFGDYVLGLPVKDTDLYKYSNVELNSDSAAAKDLLMLSLKKIFGYLKQLRSAEAFNESPSPKVFMIRMKQD